MILMEMLGGQANRIEQERQGMINSKTAKHRKKNFSTLARP